MGKLDDQLKDLQNKKLKAEFFKLLKTNIGDLSAPKFKTIEASVKDDIFSFLNSRIEAIEGGLSIEDSNTEVNNLEFTSEQVSVLIKMADRLLIKQNPKSSVVTPSKNDLETPDKISFAIKYRSLGGKRVKVKDQQEGIVTGIDAPHIVVQLETGEYTHSLVSDITVLN